MQVVTRRALEQDVERLAELFVAFHNFHAEGVPGYLRPVGPPDGELREAVRRILADSEAAVFLAEVGEAVVGFAEIYIKENPGGPAVVARKYGLLQSLFVTGERRGAGIGSRLVAAAHAWALERGATEVSLDTWEFPAGPQRFYESLGYTTARRQLVWKA